MAQRRKIFVNLPVRDLARSKAFFSALGFEYNPKFTDDKAACIVLSDDGYIMLLAEPFFRGFTDKQPCPTATHTEAICALSCDSRAEGMSRPLLNFDGGRAPFYATRSCRTTVS